MVGPLASFLLPHHSKDETQGAKKRDSLVFVGCLQRGDVTATHGLGSLPYRFPEHRHLSPEIGTLARKAPLAPARSIYVPVAGGLRGRVLNRPDTCLAYPFPTAVSFREGTE